MSFFARFVDWIDSQVSANSSPAGTDKLAVIQSTTTKSLLLSVLGTWIIQTFSGFLQSGSGTVVRSVQSKLRDLARSPSDFTGASTTAILQAMIDDGRLGEIPPGTYITTSTLSFISNNNIGQKWLGNGSTSNGGVGPNAVIFQPTSAVSVAILIDGQGGVAIQGWEIGGFTIDMANMTDASSRIGVRQVKAFNGKLINIQTINEGTSKRSFKFEAGAYTTEIDTCRGTIAELAGTSLVDATTTLMFKNCDFDQYKMQYAASISVLCGAIQGALNKFDLADINGLLVTGCDIEGTGTAYVIGANVSNVRSVFNEWSGFSGTYKSGSAIGGIPVSLDSYGTFAEPAAITYVSSSSVTPVLFINGSSAGITYNNQGFLYTRNSRSVSCILDLSINSNGAGVGAATIGTLPFAGNASYTQNFPINLVSGTYTGSVWGQIAAGGSTISILINNAGTQSAAQETNVIDSCTLRAEFTYQM